jgi:hypothetical protein
LAGTGARHAAQQSSFKGAAPAGRLWLFVARGPGRPEGVAPVTRNAGLHRLRDCGGGIPRAGYRDFSLPACVRSPDNPSVCSGRAAGERRGSDGVGPRAPERTGD